MASNDCIATADHTPDFGTFEASCLMRPDFQEGDKEDVLSSCLERADGIIQLLLENGSAGRFISSDRIITNALWALDGIISQARMTLRFQPGATVNKGVTMNNNHESSTEIAVDLDPGTFKKLQAVAQLEGVTPDELVTRYVVEVLNGKDARGILRTACLTATGALKSIVDDLGTVRGGAYAVTNLVIEHLGRVTDKY